jgi:hypothetical protein
MGLPCPKKTAGVDLCGVARVPGSMGGMVPLGRLLNE